jgi:EVE domain
VQYWIAVAGTAERPLDNDWRARQAKWEGNQGNVHMFRSRPRIRVGDRLVMYASGSPGRFGAGRFFAVREVVSDPQLSEHERWPWKLSVQEIVGGPELERCPTIEQIDVESTSVRRQSHIRLDERAGILAEELLKQAWGPDS